MALLSEYQFYKMLKNLFLLLSAFFFNKSFGQTSATIDKYINQVMAQNHIPGAAIAVIKNGVVIKESYYGLANIEDSAPVTNQSVFEIASMSKQFTCAAILLLQEGGKLSVNDKVSKYLDSLPASWQNITIKQLMNHTSGLRDDWAENTGYFLENYTDEKMFSAQKNVPLLFKPGEMFNYSSGPFDLGLIIKKITGQSYGQFLEEKIFTPLKMISTSVYDNKRIVSRRVKGYVWRDTVMQNGAVISPAAEARGDVGVITSLPDMIKWNAALKTNRLLNADSRQQMFSPGKLADGTMIGHGYGWFIVPHSGHLVIEHSGGFRTGFTSDILQFHDIDLDVIVLCNQWNGGISSFKIASIVDTTVKLVSEIEPKKDPRATRTEALTTLIQNQLYDTSNHANKFGRLFLGLMPRVIRGGLNGFKSLSYIDSINLSRPIAAYGEKITRIIFCKAIGTPIGFLSFYFNDKDELVCIWPDNN
jgi:CubicO group peptidase (beta-lactamase class C family)